MERASWPRAVAKGRSSQGGRKPESPRILNQREIGKPRAHSPVLAAWPAASLTLHLYLWGGTEQQAPQYRLAEKNQAACYMSAPPTPLPLDLSWGEGLGNIRERLQLCFENCRSV